MCSLLFNSCLCVCIVVLRHRMRVLFALQFMFLCVYCCVEASDACALAV